MTPHRFFDNTPASNPTWRHPTIDHERGLSDSTRGLPQRERQSADYRNGYADGVEWMKGQNPMRFRSEQR